MFTWLVFLFILGIIIIAHEFGHFVVAKKMGVRVENFSLGFGPKIFSKKKNSTEYSLSIIPLGGYVKLAGDNLEEYKGRPDEFLSKSPKKRAAIIFFGPLFNYFLGFLFFWLIFSIGYPMVTTKIGGILDGFGAKEAGIKLGDKIIAVDGKKVEFWEELQKNIHQKKPDTEVALTVLRDNKEQLIKVKIKSKEITDLFGQKRNVGLLGITPTDEFVKVRYGVFKAFLFAINKVGDLTFMTYKALGLMLTGKMSMRESVTGPLGIFYITSEAARLGLTALLHLIAVLNISLAIFNLLPFPVLDGGHLVLLAIEKIRGKYLKAKTERMITQIGLTILIALAIIITYNDFLRFFSNKFSNLFLK